MHANNSLNQSRRKRCTTESVIRVSEFASGDVDAVELAQLNKCTQIIALIKAAVSDVQLKVLIRVSEFTSGNVAAVELAQLVKLEKGSFSGSATRNSTARLLFTIVFTMLLPPYSPSRVHENGSSSRLVITSLLVRK